ncbi:MAG: aldo/keto reductase [Clostridia bacterium]|nr:aldo/keto reductase [Clostridia bacterium]
MIFTDFQGKKLPLLGFGCMRLPLIEGTSQIDEKETAKMVKTAMENGVNYFDTAFPYHGGQSEIVMGNVLKEYERDSFYLASKYPGHQVASSYDPKGVFELQLKKCQVEYFDFYLLHNVCEISLATYEDPKWGIIDYFVEQKKQGRIKHLGFSTHAGLENMNVFLEKYGDIMEFCQIQLNYLDWTLQKGKEKCELLNKYDIPIWIMEPVRGGKLAALPEKDEEALRKIEPKASMASWALRYLQDIKGVQMILSGMSNMEQLTDNIATFETRWHLSDEEKALLYNIAEGFKDSVPCTGCGYCMEGCPMELDIPMMLQRLNELRVTASFNSSMVFEIMPEDKLPSACIACGQCAAACPQKIDIPERLNELTEKLKTTPSWLAICKEREEAAKKLQM